MDRDQRSVLSALQSALVNAGWRYKDWNWDPVWKYESGGDLLDVRDAVTGNLYGKVGVVNVVVEYAMHSDPPSGPAAEALAAVLNEVGIVATSEYANATNQNFNAVHVLVGSKQ